MKNVPFLLLLPLSFPSAFAMDTANTDHADGSKRQIRQTLACVRQVIEKRAGGRDGAVRMGELLTRLRDAQASSAGTPEYRRIRNECRDYRDANRGANGEVYSIDSLVRRQTLRVSPPVEKALRMLALELESPRDNKFPGETSGYYTCKAFSLNAAVAFIVGGVPGAHAGRCLGSNGRRFVVLGLNGSGIVAVGATVTGSMKYFHFRANRLASTDVGDEFDWYYPGVLDSDNDDTGEILDGVSAGLIFGAVEERAYANLKVFPLPNQWKRIEKTLFAK